MNDAVCGGEVGLNYCGVNAASLDGNGPVGARCYHVEVEVVAGVKSVYPLVFAVDNINDPIHVEPVVADQVHLEYVLEPVLVADDAVKGEIVAPGVVARNEQRNVLRPFEGVVELFVVGVVDRLHEAAEDAAVFVLQQLPDVVVHHHQRLLDQVYHSVFDGDVGLDDFRKDHSLRVFSVAEEGVTLDVIYNGIGISGFLSEGNHHSDVVVSVG